MLDLSHSLDALLLVIVANIAPWAAGRVLSERWCAPLDGGAKLADGSRVLGDHKTWRGVAVGILACALAGRLLHHSLWLGAAFGVLSLAADCASSFFKRRLRLPPGTEMPGVDQLPEAWIPLLLLAHPLGLRLVDTVAVAVIFTLLDLAALRLRHPLAAVKR